MPKRYVTIFGLHEEHDVGVALIKDVKVLAALHEREAHDG